MSRDLAMTALERWSWRSQIELLRTSLGSSEDEEELAKLLSRFNGDVESVANVLLSKRQAPAAASEVVGSKRQRCLASFLGCTSGPLTKTKELTEIRVVKKNGTFVELDAQSLSDHAPCSLFTDIFDPSVANELLQAMLQDSQEWRCPEWTVFGKAGKAHHGSAHFELDEANEREPVVDMVYARHALRRPLPRRDLMDHVVHRITSAVRDGGRCLNKDWTPNFLFTNVYKNGAEHTGLHSDMLNDIGPKPTIASVSLGVARLFRLRRARDWNGDWEEWKHEVPVEADKRLVVHPLSGLTRVNLTFRMRRDDYVKKAPRCTCDRTCRLKPVFKQGDNCGRYFWACFGRAGETCEFFQWDS